MVIWTFDFYQELRREEKYAFISSTFIFFALKKEAVF